MDFTPFPKVPRWSREVVITEKIDGTNASVHIEREDPDWLMLNPDKPGDVVARAFVVGDVFNIRAGSRKRWLQPEGVGPKGCDNFGFAAWVRDNVDELVHLGPGHHFGEWWGRGIQRGYDQTEKHFSLFNTHRWADNRHRNQVELKEGQAWAPSVCRVVPILNGPMPWGVPVHDVLIDVTMARLKDHGSVAAPEYMTPAGIMIFHTAARPIFKKTFEGDSTGKDRSA